MMNKEEKIVNGYYQSNIKTSRNEDSAYAMKYASQQMLIEDLQQRIDKAIEYMKPRFMNCIDNDKRYFEDNDIQEIYEILGGKE